MIYNCRARVTGESMPKKPKKLQEPIQSAIVPGPCKSRPTGPPPARFTTHKKRSAWFQQRAAYPVREANVDGLMREKRKFSAAAPVVAPNWEQIGPTNIGGRMT